MLRFLGCCVLVSLWAVTVLAEKPLPPGIVAQRPGQGVFVETSAGFMVPYVAKIPGTSATIEMLPVPGGLVQIGSPANEAGRIADEESLRLVRVEPFWIGIYEVTIAQYRPFLDTRKVFRESENARIGRANLGPLADVVNGQNQVDAVTAPTEVYEISYHFEYGDDAHPVSTVTQFGARQYTKWLSLLRGENEFYRLPTEAEWEYACRAGTKTAYHFGNDPANLSKYATVRGDTENTGPTHVGQKLPNGWGLYDMHGNVAEWVIDAPGPREASTPNAQPLDWKEAIVWPTTVELRMLRGGGWTSTAAGCRSAARMVSDLEWWENDPDIPRSPFWFAGDEVTQSVGFRIVRSLHSLSRAEQERFWSPDCPDLVRDVNDQVESGRGIRGIVSPKLAPELDSHERQRQLDLNRLKREKAKRDESTRN